MFVRWKRRQMTSNRQPTGEWVRYAVLVRSERVGGKVRQKFVCHLAYIREDVLGHFCPRLHFWEAVDAKLEALDLPAKELAALRKALAVVVPRLTAREKRAAEVEVRALWGHKPEGP